MNTEFDSILHQVTECLKNPAPRNAKLEVICHLLKDGVGHYDWVGFYLVDANNRRELVLGPYAGIPTEHRRIPFGAGICGQAAERKKTFVVQDVTRETNYLSCSPEVKSEIVVPIFKGGEIAGELDIDSHTRSPFTAADRDFLEKVSKSVSEIL